MLFIGAAALHWLPRYIVLHYYCDILIWMLKSESNKLNHLNSNQEKFFLETNWRAFSDASSRQTQIALFLNSILFAFIQKPAKPVTSMQLSWTMIFQRENSKFKFQIQRQGSLFLFHETYKNLPDQILTSSVVGQIIQILRSKRARLKI